MEHFDIVILGAGSAAELIWPNVPGRSVAVVEEHRVGGECAYVACMPSKAMLRSASVRGLVPAAPGLGAISEAPPADDRRAAFAAAVARRDRISEGRDDRRAAEELRATGARLFRGFGRLSAPDRVLVDDQELQFDELVIATGSEPSWPPVDGLGAETAWTSDQLLSSSELPASMAVLGGGPVGCELAQAYSAFGCRVTLLEAADQLLAGEPKEIADLLAESLRGHGVEVLLGAKLRRVSGRALQLSLEIEERGTLRVERLLLATGRRPRVAGLGLELLGIHPAPGRGLEIDDQGRVKGAQHLWAAGDVTAVAPFTHAASYHSRVIAANLRGEERRLDQRAMPRCVYTDPPVASVGQTTARAGQPGWLVGSFDLEETARSSADGAGPGRLLLFAGAEDHLVRGASCLGVATDEWMGVLTLAVRSMVRLETLADTVMPFPTYSEAVPELARRLLGVEGEREPGAPPRG